MATEQPETPPQSRPCPVLSDEPDRGENGQDIRETDIVFDCPHCGKSLAIDYHGAGLIVNCSDCGQAVEVPIPEGLELDDLDQTPEDLEVQIIHLRQTVVKLGAQIREQNDLIQGLKVRRVFLEKNQAENLRRLAEIRLACEVIQRAQLELSSSVGRILELIRQDDDA